MATAPKTTPPASAPKDATKTTVWQKLFGGGGVDNAAKEIGDRKSKIDKQVDGYKNGGMVGGVKCTKSATKRSWG